MKKSKVLIATLAVATLFVGCSQSNEKVVDTNTITVGATPVPHTEILEFSKELFAEKGYELEIIEFTDYEIPNKALDSGEIYANFFQHTPFLDKYNEQTGADLLAVSSIHFEPLGIYAGKSNDLKNIKDGAKIAVPSDTTNEARALQLLANQGIIELKDGVGLNATPLDITSNPFNVEIVELEAATITHALLDLDFAVVNGNYALSADILDKVLVTEDQKSEAGITFSNIIVVQNENKDNEKTKILIEVLTSDEVKNFINETYGASVIPVF